MPWVRKLKPAMAEAQRELVVVPPASGARRRRRRRPSGMADHATSGRTPLVWGGAGAPSLGLAGNVTLAQYDALFAPGGACDPTTGQRVVEAQWPGLELILEPHHSVAMLGVIGRAEDMHQIMDAERDATMAYLDELATVPASKGMSGPSSEGLIYATTRHASLAGEPRAHDHVLVASAVRTSADYDWRRINVLAFEEHAQPAMMVGRMAAAHVAVERGYAIVPVDELYKVGGWAIDGVAADVIDGLFGPEREVELAMKNQGYEDLAEVLEYF